MNAQRIVVAALAVMFGLGACGSSDEQAVPAVSASGSEIFPSATLADWVSFSVQLSVVDVTGERSLPPPSEEQGAGEGYVGREVTLQIEETPWVGRPHEQLSGTVTMVAPGSARHDGLDSPIAVEGVSTRFEVGERLLVPLALDDGRVGPLSYSAVFHLDADGRILDNGGPLAAQLAGKTPAEVGAMLESTRPDPIAERYRHLPARQQAAETVRERYESQQQGPP